MRRHLGNISRLVGHDVSNHYHYIATNDELTTAWINFHNDLGYPLKIDSKYRRALIYNKHGLEHEIEKCINNCITSSASALVDIISNDVVN